MNKNRCTNCNVFVQSDIKYCPLCGKFLTESVTQATYPLVDQSYTVVEKWIKMVRAILVLIGILSVAINLFFTTHPYWFPYVLVGLFALWRILFYPFKEGKSHVASIPMSGIVVAILLVFIDVYNNKTTGAGLGWALCYSAPAVLTGTTLISFILAITNQKYEETLTKKIGLLLVVELLFLGSKLLWFNQFLNWPVFMSLLTSFVTLFLLFLFKKKRLLKELNRSFKI